MDSFKFFPQFSLTVIVFAAMVSRSSQCGEPSESSLQAKLSGLNPVDTGLLLGDHEWKANNGRTSIYGTTQDGCQSTTGRLCSTEALIDTNPLRYPRTIEHVRCHCSSCRSTRGNLGTCKPLYKNVEVFLRGECNTTDTTDITGVYRYNLVAQPKAVACVCVETVID